MTGPSIARLGTGLDRDWMLVPSSRDNRRPRGLSPSDASDRGGNSEAQHGVAAGDTVMAHRAIDTLPNRGMRVDAATPCAFRFYPELYPDGMLRFSVGSPEPVVVSVHGPGSGSCRIDGQLMEDGRQYPLKDGTVLQAETNVGVHLRPLKDARLRLPDANG